MIIEIPDDDIQDADKLARALCAVIQSRWRPEEEQKRLEVEPREDGQLAVSLGPKPVTEHIE
jgi:hypothetical protein